MFTGTPIAPSRPQQRRNPNRIWSLRVGGRNVSPGFVSPRHIHTALNCLRAVCRALRATTSLALRVASVGDRPTRNSANVHAISSQRPAVGEYRPEIVEAMASAVIDVDAHRMS